MLRDKLDIIIARLMIWSIKRGYGADCGTRDIDDFTELADHLNSGSRCASCKAREVIDWIRDHIDLIQG